MLNLNLRLPSDDGPTIIYENNIYYILPFVANFRWFHRLCIRLSLFVDFTGSPRSFRVQMQMKLLFFALKQAVGPNFPINLSEEDELKYNTDPPFRILLCHYVLLGKLTAKKEM